MCVAQAGLEFLGSSIPPASVSQVAGTTGVCHTGPIPPFKGIVSGICYLRWELTTTLALLGLSFLDYTHYGSTAY
jgi:hypothetical protein